MATIQIRDVPDDLHELLTDLARRSGQSLQAFMREQIVSLAEARTAKADAIARLEELLERDGGAGGSAEQIVADLDADRR